jgi:hypothetical protein
MNGSSASLKLKEEEDVLPRPKNVGVCARLWAYVHRRLHGVLRVFDIYLLRNVDFLLFCVTCALTNLAYQAVPILLVHYASECGLSKNNGADLIAIGGVADTISRASTGFVFATHCIRRVRKFVWAAAILIIGLDIAAYAFANTMWHFWVCAAVYGLSTGVYASQLTVIAADLVTDPHRVPNAIGLTIFSRGVGVAVGPFVAGAFRDVTGNYGASFLFCGAIAIFAAFATTALSRLISHIRAKRRHDNEKASRKTPRVHVEGPTDDDAEDKDDAEQSDDEDKDKEEVSGDNEEVRAPHERTLMVRINTDATNSALWRVATTSTTMSCTADR